MGWNNFVKVNEFLFFKKIFSFIYLFIYWLCWVFIVAHGLLTAVASLVAEHGL